MKFISIILLLSTTYISGADYIPKNITAQNFDEPIKTFNETEISNAKSTVTLMYADVVKLQAIYNDFKIQSRSLSVNPNDPNLEINRIKQKELDKKAEKVYKEQTLITTQISGIIKQYDLQLWYAELKKPAIEQLNAQKKAEQEHKRTEIVKRAKLQK